MLAVDDDPHILKHLQRTLADEGYHVIITGDPGEAVKKVRLENPDLVLLDMMLPGASGLEVMDRIRKVSEAPVIFLTGRGRDEGMVEALKRGADDYMTKPFSPSELVARIDVALRRRVAPDQAKSKSFFVLKDLRINFVERTVTIRGEDAGLSAMEYKMLCELATHAGRVLTHDQILARVWGDEYAGETELVRALVRRLRQKLGDNARHPAYIFTESQVGYRMPKPDLD